MFPRFILLILALHCFLLALCHANEDCDTLFARCRVCKDGTPDNSGITKAINRKCNTVVGRQFVWRNLSNCEMLYYLCEVMPWDCDRIARRAGMQRRLP